MCTDSCGLSSLNGNAYVSILWQATLHFSTEIKRLCVNTARLHFKIYDSRSFSFVTGCHLFQASALSFHWTLTHPGVLEMGSHSHPRWRPRRGHGRGVGWRVEVQHYANANVILQFIRKGKIKHVIWGEKVKSMHALLINNSNYLWSLKAYSKHTAAHIWKLFSMWLSKHKDATCWYKKAPSYLSNCSRSTTK